MGEANKMMKGLLIYKRLKWDEKIIEFNPKNDNMN